MHCTSLLSCIGKSICHMTNAWLCAAAASEMQFISDCQCCDETQPWSVCQAVTQSIYFYTMIVITFHQNMFDYYYINLTDRSHPKYMENGLCIYYFNNLCSSAFKPRCTYIIFLLLYYKEAHAMINVSIIQTLLSVYDVTDLCLIQIIAKKWNEYNYCINRLMSINHCLTKTQL